MDPRLTELSTTFELFKEAQINTDPLTSDQILSQLELLLARFRSLPSSSEQGPDAAQGLSDGRCCHCASPIGARTTRTSLALS
ncbi:26S proteasome non-ATPase regulatory subunit 8 homolog A-like protein [Drosera capensis]